MDWTDIFETEYNATLDRYTKQQNRIQKQEGFGSTDGGLAIVRANLKQLVTTLEQHIDIARSPNSLVSGLVPLLLQMKPELLALCAMQTLLHTMGTGVVFGQQVSELGLALEAEVFRAGLSKHDKKLAGEVAKRAAGVRGGTAAKRGMARVQASKAGFKIPEWSQHHVVAAGGWMVDWLCSTLPEVFVITGDNEWKAVRLSESALEAAQVAVDRMAESRPVFMPRPVAPDPWTRLAATDETGPLLAFRSSLLRTGSEDRLAAARESIKDGTLLPCLTGLNRLQGVPWRINRQVLLVQMACLYAGIEVDGLPGKRLDLREELVKDGLDPFKPWKELTKEERTLWIRKARGVRNHNDALIGEKLSLAEDWKAAKMYRDQEFYTAMNLDWRGRVYGRCRFNYQREDRVRGLFLFERGEPLGEHGLDALLIHAANCWGRKVSEKDTRKSDKLPTKEKVEWARNNMASILASAKSPMTERWWMTAGEPWCFLATCFEIRAATRTAGGPANHVCRLPVAYDGSCSGVQHLSLLTKAANEAALVNLLPANVPADIYAAVAAIALKKIAANATSVWPEDESWKGEVAKLALAWGITRDEAKRNTMTWAYSSKRYGMGGQQQEDLMAELEHKLLLGKLEDRDGNLLKEHPFAPYHRGSKDHPGKAARYLGNIFYDSIQEVMLLPGMAMLFLQAVAKVLAHEGRYVTWVSPSGLPCINHYNPLLCERITLYTHIKGVKVKHQTTKVMGEEALVDKAKCASGISPNYVHSHDASHVHLVAAACDFDLATVHDSFACVPSRAGELQRILREQLVAMYQDKDLLKEVYDRAYAVLSATGQQKLPLPPKQGNLDITQVLDAEYAFA